MDVKRMVERLRTEPLDSTKATLPIYDLCIEAAEAIEYLAQNNAYAPCRIGDMVWGIRSYKGVKHPELGAVSEIYFSREMKLCIVVKHVCRGEWGQDVFPTEEAAQAAIAKGRKR